MTYNWNKQKGIITVKSSIHGFKDIKYFTTQQ